MVVNTSTQPAVLSYPDRCEDQAFWFADRRFDVHSTLGLPTVVADQGTALPAGGLGMRIRNAKLDRPPRGEPR